MNAGPIDRSLKQGEWSPSVFYVECLIECSIEHAWPRLLDYEAWNPSFVGAQVEPVYGAPQSEGEVVLIKKTVPRADGKLSPEFYAETVKVVPSRRVVWYVHPKEGNAFRNFVDFSLTEVSNGVKFNVCYYAQHPLSGESLRIERIGGEAALHTYAQAFKKYCESSATR